jgi:integrase
MKLYVKKAKTKQGVKESLWVDFTHGGKRYRKSLKLDSTPANKKLATTKIIPQLMLKLHSGTLFDNAMLTVDEAMKKSFLLQRGNRSEAVQYDYGLKYKKHILPVFGDKKIDIIKGTDITIWQNDLRDKNGLRVKSIKQIRGLLYTMYEDMIDDGYEIKNPVKLAAKLSERDEIVKEVVPFNMEEIHNILAVADEQRKNMYAVLFYTGLRGGEMLALKWDKVDFDRKTIDVDLKVRKGVFGRPKWNSVRAVPIIDALMPFMLRQYEMTGRHNSYVFLNTLDTHYWDIGKITSSAWRKDLKKAGVPYRSIHTTRSTFISTLISNGEDILYVSKIAGHKNVNVTLEKYSRYIPKKNVGFGKCFTENQ